MARVAGIRFKKAGQVYLFDAGEIELQTGDNVIVETARGTAIGDVVIPPAEREQSESDGPLKPVLRLAQPEDLQRAAELKEKESKAVVKARELVTRYQVPMTLLAAESNLDGTHLTIYFKSEKRVDFRSLLRELSATLKTRVELRQVGARDAAKLVGGMGRCGFNLCCASHLCKFETISMRMAREQDLPLNPANISGVCGRLLCCLAYENEQYRAMKQKLPMPGRNVVTEVGDAKIVGCNPLKETVIVKLESEATLEMPVTEIEESRGDSGPSGSQ
ncbi:MAG: stage 0 sporulation family protein [Dehalococcoidia bacterium]|nr:stage 0 sporulation family protein [Dehalococcoidia bacterium]